ncbi:hypothetical protein DSCW_48880 [Desulfosarcina widdelii]|uniref:Uncharacterized protein n=1 Tax=Desulfosarcina widdelii TaxID=947919 RepID=A0A5K7ZCL5_9BACT|nr:hypothetical protein DSCW_48880 [Desulfosarcina widdelii]
MEAVKVVGNGSYLSAETHFVDTAGKDIGFVFFVQGISHGCLRNPIEVLNFDPLRINENKIADAIPCELFHHETTGARASDDTNLQSFQQLIRPLAKGLRNPDTIFIQMGELFP